MFGDGKSLEAKGKPSEALEAYVSSRAWDDAIRVAVALNRHGDAARYCLEAGRPYDAAVCFQKAGAMHECLKALTKVAPTSTRYRSACVQAVRVAMGLNAPLASLSTFFMPFLSLTPAAPVEGEAFKALGDAFAGAGKERLAVSIYRTVVQVFPKDEEAKERLAELEQQAAAAATSASGLFSAVGRSSASGLYPALSSAPGGAAKTGHTPPPFSSSPSMTGTPVSSAGVFQSSPSGMRAMRQRLADLVVAKGLVPPVQVGKLLRDQPELGNSEAAFAEALVAANLVKEEPLLQLQGETFGLGWLTDADAVRAVSPEAARALGQEQAETFRVAPLRVVERQLHVAMENPRDVAVVDKLRFITSHAIVPYFATAAGVRRARSKLYTGHDPGAAELPAWHGRLFGDDGGMVVEPFSDRVTGTREHQFDTGEFQLEDVRAAGLPPPPPPPQWPPSPGRVAESTPRPVPAELPPPPEWSAGPVTPDLPPPPRAAGPVVTPQTLNREPLPPAPPPGVAHGPAPTVGSLVANRYVLEALLGEGGSATVFRARDLELEEPVAIKLFHPMSQKEADSLVARFKLELSLSRALAHPNIVRLFDLGTHGGSRYLTLELLEGEDLATRLEKRRGPLPIAEALSYLAQLCDGLQAAHERGVVHRDIKPPNLFVTGDGTLKLMDFGIARRVNTPGVTVVGTIAGTPEYMSPEQINGFSEVTAPADLYSVGATAYQLLTGVVPFAYPELTRVLIAQATEVPRPLRERNPRVPPWLEHVVLSLLEKDPTKRPPSARAVADALRRGA